MLGQIESQFFYDHFTRLVPFSLCTKSVEAILVIINCYWFCCRIYIFWFVCPVKDFLAVRSLSIICLFYSREVLDSAWLQDSPGRLLLVTITYFIIVAALYFGAWPFRFRDFFIWLDKNDYMVKLIALSFSAIGLILLAVSFTL